MIPKTTHALLRITSITKAQEMVNKGRMYFGTPKRWIEYAKTSGNNTIGDLYEGSYLCNSILSSTYVNYHRNKYASMIVGNNVYEYDDNIINLPVFCMYGINDTNFSDRTIVRGNISQRHGFVDKSYFKDFDNGNEDNAVVMISKPKEFFDKIIAAAKKMGFKENEVLIGPVEYINKKKQHLIVKEPNELFLKDESYSNQNEIRIVLYSKDKEVIYNFNKKGFYLEIGNITDIAFISDMYDKSMNLAIQNDNKLLYELSKPLEIPFEEMSFEDIISIVCEFIVRNETYSNTEFARIIRDFNNILQNNFNITFYYENVEKRINPVFAGIDDELNSMFDEVVKNYKKYIEKYHICIFTEK